MTTHDFETWRRAQYADRQCSLRGRDYTGMPDLPMSLGIRWATIATDADPSELVQTIIDYTFGAGTFDYLADYTIDRAEHGPAFTVADFGNLIFYIKSDFNNEVFAEFFGALKKTVNPDAPSTSPPSGPTSLLTSNASTTSTSSGKTARR